MSRMCHPDRISRLSGSASKEAFKNNLDQLSQRCSNVNAKTELYGQAQAVLEATKALPSIGLVPLRDNDPMLMVNLFMAKFSRLWSECMRYSIWIQYIMYWLQAALNLLLIVLVVPFVCILALCYFIDTRVSCSDFILDIVFGIHNYLLVLRTVITEKEIADYCRQTYDHDLTDDSDEDVLTICACPLWMYESRESLKLFWLKEYYQNNIVGWRRIMILTRAIETEMNKAYPEHPVRAFLSGVLRGIRLICFFPVFLLLDSVNQFARMVLTVLLIPLMMVTFAVKLVFTVLLIAPLLIYDAWNAYIARVFHQEAVSASDDRIPTDGPSTSCSTRNELSGRLYLLGWTSDPLVAVLPESDGVLTVSAIRGSL